MECWERFPAFMRLAKRIIGREVIYPEVLWSVGDGNSMKVREEKWISAGLIKGPANREDPQTVAELIEPESNRWNEQKLNEPLMRI